MDTAETSLLRRPRQCPAQDAGDTDADGGGPPRWPEDWGGDHHAASVPPPRRRENRGGTVEVSSLIRVAAQRWTPAEGARHAFAAPPRHPEDGGGEWTTMPCRVAVRRTGTGRGPPRRRCTKIIKRLLNK